MIAFLTSSPVIGRTAVLNPANGFLDELRKVYSHPRSVLFICSNPDAYEMTDAFSASVQKAFAQEGFLFSSLQILDRRTQNQCGDMIQAADMIFLSGGHVPTQNRFFQEIGLAEKLKEFEGIVIGISAGSMNSAQTVYAQPELKGEAVSKSYQRFLPGLGLTKTMILPHYQMIKYLILDGLRVMEDITYPDSMGRSIYALPDGSYLLLKDGREELHGEAWLISDGEIRLINRENQVLVL